jgi:uncharacterized membrane protein
VSEKIAMTQPLAAHSTVWFSISVVKKCHFYSVMKGTNLVSETLASCSEPIQLAARYNFCHYGLIYVYLISLGVLQAVCYCCTSSLAVCVFGAFVCTRISASTCCPLDTRQEATPHQYGWWGEGGNNTSGRRLAPQ